MTVVPVGEVKETMSFDEVRARRAIPVVPATLGMSIRNLADDHIQIDEIYLMPGGHESSTNLRDWAVIAYPLPGAGGRGPEAAFEVWHRARRAASIALLASALSSGGDVSKPLLAPRDGYTVLLDIFPDAPGLHTYEIWARCSSNGKDWSQPLLKDLRVLRIRPNEYKSFQEVVLVRFGSLTKIVSAMPDYFLTGRESGPAWRNWPQIPSERSALITGYARRLSEWPGSWRT